MQLINDDIDDLYRRAAEDYPLHTDSGNWNKVFGALQEPHGAQKNKPVSMFKNGAILMALFVVPLWLQHNPARKADANTIKEQSIVRQTVPIDCSNGTFPYQNKGETLQPASMQKHVNSFNLSPRKKRLKDVSESPSEGASSIHKPYMDTVKDENKDAEPVRAMLTSLLLRPRPAFFFPGSAPYQRIEFGVHGPHPKKMTSRYFSISLMAGIDKSTIRHQKTSNPGYSTGALITYPLTNLLSVEAGAFLSQKSYYTKGEYFHIKQYANTSIQSVEGKCRMIELPLQAKYQFAGKDHRYWYAIVGMSSYLMKKEDYEYQYTTGSSTPLEGYKTYRNSTNNWLSVMNLKAGYTLPVGNFGALRVEPYLGIPLKGLGIGRLPITSAGLNVGITKRI